MDWFRATGEFGRLTLAATAGVTIAALVAAYWRAPRRIAIGLFLLCLLPGALGFVGTVAHITTSSQQIRTLRAPTPRDLSAEVDASQTCLRLGMAGSAIALVAAALAYVRSPRPDEPPPM